MRPTTHAPALLFASLCLLPPTAALAQSFIVPPVSFTGAPAFDPAALLAVTDLKPGSTANQAAVQAAAQRLNDTGLFSGIHFESNSKGIVFKLTPMPADAVLSATFTNFVWWQPAELASLLKARVPLFVGSVPTSGNLQDAVTAALTSLVKGKGIASPQISAIPFAAPGAAPSSLRFSIDAPPVVIHSLVIPSDLPALQPRLASFANQQAGKPWDENASRHGIASGIADIYRDDGYLDVDLTSLTYTPPTITPESIAIDLAATISAGEPYRITSVTWAGSDILSTADFNKTLKLHPEDIASQSALRDSLRPLANAYSAHGYQDARIQAPATVDRATHHVAYTVSAIPGEQYRLQAVHTLGLTDVQQKQFDSAWRLHPGDPYDTIYVSTFLQKNSALLSLRGHSATFKAISDPNTHLVDLTLTFVKGGELH